MIELEVKLEFKLHEMFEVLASIEGEPGKMLRLAIPRSLLMKIVEKNKVKELIAMIKDSLEHVIRKAVDEVVERWEHSPYYVKED